MTWDFQENGVWCDQNACEEMALKFKKNIYYQPIVDAAASHVLFYESLLRFVGEDGEVFSPTPFVNKAEADGSISALDAESLSMVFRTLAEQPCLNLSLNVSCLSLDNPLWALQFYEGAKACPDILPRLIVEVTETRNFSLSPAACDRLRHIGSMGVRLALDDVDQVPFSCLQDRLKSQDFSVDFLKISRHLTMDLHKSPHHRGKFSDLLDLAHDCGAMPIIEGVETKPQCDAFCAKGLFLQQGYYWGHPASVFNAVVPV
jgi:EAL domain-containing protein (putative c-di-GMP-specific phosphodiesterase class I)